MSEQTTTFQSLRNKDWKKVKLEIEKANKLLQHILTDSNTEMNELICAGGKLFRHKIGILQRNPKRKTKPGREMRLEA